MKLDMLTLDEMSFISVHFGITVDPDKRYSDDEIESIFAPILQYEIDGLNGLPDNESPAPEVSFVTKIITKVTAHPDW